MSRIRRRTGRGSRQYWRSVDELHRVAPDPTAPHAAAERELNREVGAEGTVGVLHETDVVGPDPDHAED